MPMHGPIPNPSCLCVSASLREIGFFRVST